MMQSICISSQSHRQTSDVTCSGKTAENVQISDVSDVKTGIILIEFLISQNKINGTIF